jgi:hypothetical protein
MWSTPASEQRLHFSTGENQLSKRDYVLLADAIREALASVNDRAPVKLIVDALAACLQRDNIRFDKQRFVAACGL